MAAPLLQYHLHSVTLHARPIENGVCAVSQVERPHCYSSEFGERSCQKRVLAGTRSRKPITREGNRKGRNESLEVRARERERGK